MLIIYVLDTNYRYLTMSESQQAALASTKHTPAAIAGENKPLFVRTCDEAACYNVISHFWL